MTAQLDYAIAAALTLSALALDLLGFSASGAVSMQTVYSSGEPASLMLFGSALSLLAVGLRRRHRS
jgi:hypothetical protein